MPDFGFKQRVFEGLKAKLGVFYWVVLCVSQHYRRGLIGAHVRPDKILSLVLSRFWKPGLASQVRTFVDQCQSCQGRLGKPACSPCSCDFYEALEFCFNRHLWAVSEN